MKRPRVTWTRTLRNAAIGVSLLILAVWMLSFWWIPTYTHFSERKPTIEIRFGCLAIWSGFAHAGDPSGFALKHCHGNWGEFGGLARGNLGFIYPRIQKWPGQRLIVLPLWIPWATVALLGFWSGYHIRKTQLPGHCRFCGYNLRGNVSGVCPECGEPIADAAPYSPRESACP